MAPAISEWDEVKRLAADFQRAQAISSLQKLSDRNCIDVINKLKDLSLLDVIYSLDGKEYITKEHLKKEIYDELIVAGGRIHLTEVSSILNVDISHIESKASELVQESAGSICFVLGQLISQAYKEKLIEEIEQNLSQTGSSSVSEITKQYDLPADFITSLLKSNLTTGSSIQWSVDGTIFTQSFLNRYKSKVRGILFGSVVPLSLSVLTSPPHNIPSKVMSSILEDKEFVSALPGTVQMSKGSSSKTYIPSIYSVNQRNYVTSFYNDNNYLQYELLRSLGITEPKSFITKTIPEAIHLNTVAVSPSIEATVSEAVSSTILQDLSIILPTVLSSEDIEKLYNSIGNNDSTKLLCKSVIVPSNIIESIGNSFEQQMQETARLQYEDGTLATYFTPKADSKDREKDLTDEKSSNLSRKDERRRKAASGSGTTKQMTGGGQGREVKTKAVKKKPRGAKNQARVDSEDEDEEASQIASETTHGIKFMSLADLTIKVNQMNTELEETHQDLPKEIAKLLLDKLNKKYAEVARKIWSEHISSAGNSKKIHADLQSTLSQLYAQIHLAISALDSFDNESHKELKGQLAKHLQKTLCTDACNALIAFVIPDENVNLSTPDARTKAINKISDSTLRDSLFKLSNSLNSPEIDSTFLELLEAASLAGADILLKPIDKKREKTFLSENRHNLLGQMNNATDPSLALHAAVLILAQSVTGTAIHASGKFVPQIITFLDGKIPDQTRDLLNQMANLVISHVKLSKSDESQANEVKEQLDSLVPQLKAIVEKAQSN